MYDKDVEDMMIRALEQTASPSGFNEHTQERARLMLSQFSANHFSIINTGAMKSSWLSPGSVIEMTSGDPPVLRDQFAAMSLGLMLREGTDMMIARAMNTDDEQQVIDGVATMAYRVADAMLRARGS